MYGYKQYQYKKRRAVRRKLGRYNAQQRALKSYLEQTPGFSQAGVEGSARMNTFGDKWDSANETQKFNRRLYAFRGRGDYYSDKIKPMLQTLVPTGTFSKMGGAIGGYYGGKTGSTIGSALGGLASRYLGYGDYSTAPPVTNQIMGGGSGVTVNASDDNTGDLYFSHKEFLQNISVTGAANTTTTFQLTSFPINPGLTTSFPFLSQIAQNFVMYEMLGCIFEYRPTSGESGGTSNSLGKIIMATSYDPGSPNFTNSVSMENYDYATSCKPSIGQLHGVETANKQQFGNMQYIRTGATTRDLVFTDIGNFQIATEGIPLGTQTTQVLGELWVTYRVKLSRANLFGALLGNNVACDAFAGYCIGTGTAWASQNTDANRPLIIQSSTYITDTRGATYLYKKRSNSVGCSVVSLSGGASLQIQFPVNIVQGQYLINVWSNNGVSGAANPNSMSASTFVNCSAAPFHTARNTEMATTEITGNLSFVVNVNAPGNLVATVTVANTVVGVGGGPPQQATGQANVVYITIVAVSANFASLT